MKMSWGQLINKRSHLFSILTHARDFKILASLLKIDEQKAKEAKWNNYLMFCKDFEESAKGDLIRDMTVHEDFLTEEEEKSLYKEIEPYIRKLRYEYSHWDDVCINLFIYLV